MPTPWNISSEIQPNYDGGLMRAKWLKGGFRTVKNLAQRNAIPYLYRMMDAIETTVVFCETDSRFYKLINNPVGTTTLDSDWEAIVLGGLSTFSPVGSWDSNNLAPTLQDTDALGHDGEFYFVTNTPSPYTNTYTGLFQDNSVTVVDGNYIVSVGGYFIVVSNGTTWDSIAKPSVIDDYVAGTVIAHTHTTADITDLVTFLGDYLKHTDVADHTGSFAGVLDASIVDVGFLRTFYYTKTEVDSLLALAGVGAFITLTDTPTSYTGQALKLVRVNAGETGLEFTTGGTGGSLIKDASDTILTSRSWLKVYGGLTATDNSPNTDLTWGGALIANTTISGAFTVDYTNTLTRFKSGSLGVRNPANTFDYTFIGAAIVASRTITLPLLSGNDTLVTEAFAQSLTNKKLGSLTSNGFVQTSGGDGTLSVDTTIYLPIGGGTLTGPLTLNADPTIALHAATKSYVDNLVTGLSWKQAVQVATTANITLSGLQTIDGYTTLANDRVLVKNQTTQTNNGIYIAASGAWTRSLDADIASEILGSTVLVERGTLYADTQWSNNNTSITLGSTNITFAQIAGACTYTNGTGLTLTGNVFSVTTNGITYALMQQVAASSLVGNPTGSLANAQGITLGTTLTFSGSTLQTAAHTGDITTSANSFATTLATNIVSNAKFRQSSGLSIVGNSTNVTANVADIVAASDFQIMRRSGTALAFGSIDLSQSNAVGASILPIANGGTGVAGGAWLQASGATLSASNTITSNTANWLNFSSTWTATANNQSAFQTSGTITARATASDTLIGDSFSRTLTTGAATQKLSAVLINPTFTGANVGTATQYVLRMQVGGTDVASVQQNGAYSVINSSGTVIAAIDGAGGTVNGRIFANAQLLLQGNATTGSQIFAGNSIGSTMTGTVFQVSWGATGQTSGSVSAQNITGSLVTSSGSVSFTRLSIDGQINTTGGTTTYRVIDYNPTETSLTGVTNYFLTSGSTTALSGLGTRTPTATWHLVGSTGNATLKTVGAGTTTNYSYRAFQSDGTTEIYSLLDSGKNANTSTFTALANNEIGSNSVYTITQRATASDSITGAYRGYNFNIASTTQNPVGLNLDVNFIQTGGISTLATFNGAVTGSLAGMTATTYTSVAPASTSGSGTSATFDITVSNATTISSIVIHSGSNGSGYKVNDTVTFNGSQFGAGSGSATYPIRTIVGLSLGTSTTPLRVNSSGAFYVDNPKVIDLYYNNISLGYIGAMSIAGGGSTSDLAINSSNVLRVTATSSIQLVSPTTISGALTLTSSITASASNAAAGGGIFTASGPAGGFTSSSIFQSKYKTTTTINSNVVGLAQTLSLTFGGTSGYTTGVKATTGGSGSGLTINVTGVSGGVVTSINTTPSVRGTGYKINEVVTLATGSADATVTITAVDFAGSVISFEDQNTITDASSNNTYISLLARPTYNITSTQVGTIAAFYYNPTLTALGSFNNYGFVIGPNNARNSFGTLTPLANLHIVQGAQSSGWVPALRIDPGADTSLTASTGFTHINITGSTQTWIASGTAIPVQSAVWIQANTLAGATATATATVAAALQLDPWIVGTNGAITNNYTLYSTGKLGFTNTYTAGGTNGNQTINQPTGSLNIAAAGTTVTLTNSLITTNSIVYPVLMTSDATATSVKGAVVTAGQVVFTLNAACTAAVKIGFIVFN